SSGRFPPPAAATPAALARGVPALSPTWPGVSPLLARARLDVGRRTAFKTPAAAGGFGCTADKLARRHGRSWRLHGTDWPFRAFVEQAQQRQIEEGQSI